MPPREHEGSSHEPVDSVRGRDRRALPAVPFLSDTAACERPWPLVGRGQVLDLFTRALRHRRVQGILIHGPAGVGKSRLAEECLIRAERAGFRTAWAVATAAAAGVPLGAMGHLIPAGVDLSDPVAGFAAVAAGLRHSEEGRLVLLIDDLHLLDSTSVMLVRQLMDSGTVLLIGTVRSGEPFDLASAFGSGDSIHRMDISPFTEGQVAEVLWGALGRPVSVHSVHELYTASAGNALYLRELVLGALRNGSLTDDGEVWQLAAGWRVGTPRLKELIEARLARATPAGTEALELLALCEPVALADIQAVAGLDELITLERLGYVRVVKEDRRHTALLAHPLYGEALRAAIPELRRRTILLAQAGRVEARGARRQDDLLHIASWRLAATGTADRAQLERAATLARHSHDYPQVVRLLEALPPAEHTVGNRLLLADALFQSGRPDEAERVLDQAKTLATTEDDRLAVAVAYSVNALWGMAHASRALEAISSSRTDLDSPEATRTLTISEGCIHAVCGRPVEGLKLLDALGDDIDTAADISAWLIAATVKTRALQMTGDIAGALSWAENAYAIHRRVNRRALSAPHPALQLAPSVLALAEEGRIDDARALGERLFGELVGSEAGLARMWVAFFLARTEWLAGHVVSARRWYAECTALARSHHGTRPMREALGGLAACIALLGDVPGAAAALSDLNEADACMAELEYVSAIASPGRALAQAWSRAATGQLATAREILIRAADSLRHTGNISSEGLLLLDVARLGGAADVLDRLAAIALQSDGRLARARADLTAALAREEADALMSVSEELEAMGCDLLAAEAAAAASAAYRKSGRARSATAAGVRAGAVATRCEGARTPLLAMADATVPLTSRETEIAWRAAAGATSKEIAEELVLSVRTVNNHLGRVYEKLGVTSRRELARVLPDHRGAQA
ncbi:LuxR C-terminal-related transcriptional regulator [Streptomyces sp. NPDC001381]|uniref:LuxR C-terminal-related transcriptional regulator n=1 Tax=Streptomyces sp. NPDC001381 TaxID=3364567 RepID=UPI0036C886A5